MAELKQLKGIRMMSRPWQPQDLIDDLQLLIDEEPDRYLNDRRTTLCMARDYLYGFFENNPLTFEELRNMKGEPVWIVWPDGRIASQWWIVGSARWHMMEFDDDGQRDYGTNWIAYRRNPDHFREATKKVGWISVEERLPEEDGFYLVWGPTIYTDTKWYDQRSLAQYLWKHDVTHWMPLPKPPEVET